MNRPASIMLLLVIFLSLITIVRTDSKTETQIHALGKSIENLSEQIEQWKILFSSTLVTTTTSLANINNNVNNLQQRVHIWDTFQHHVSAWNAQLATLDRKADILNKGQEQVMLLESHLQTISKQDYKLDNILKKLDKDSSNNQDLLIVEFATRGVLSTIKLVEKKLDRILLQQAKSVQNNHEQTKLTVKCNTPLIVEELLNDISAKVDNIFDNLNKNTKQESSTEDYMDDGSGSFADSTERASNEEVTHLKKLHMKLDIIANQSLMVLKQQNIISIILDKLLQKTETHNTYISAIMKQVYSNDVKMYESLRNIISEYRIVDKNYFRSNCSNEDDRKAEKQSEPTKTGCEDLGRNHKSGVYIFGNTSLLNARYCTIRNDFFWTVIQRRDNYSTTESFEKNWVQYKTGFGDINKDFWLGNELISKMSQEHSLILRIELSGFEGQNAWAEYSTFRVLPEDKNYKLIVGGYSGNASDSLSSHNLSLFSTMDKKNDQAPECCPCAATFGGGWWFNNCFESNLNGLYFKQGEKSGYFGGIIWENWLGNYSLKKTVMMVRPKTFVQKHEEPSIPWPNYEDP